MTLTWSKPRPSPHSPGEVTDYVVTVSAKMVAEDDAAEFKAAGVGPVRTNSSLTRVRIPGLAPYTVYAFVVQAVNEVGQSRPSKQSYPAITLMESEYPQPFSLTWTLWEFCFQIILRWIFTAPLVPEPSGKPAVLAAHNTSSTSIYLEWAAPDAASIHGQFLGYVVSYRPRDTSPGSQEAREARLPHPGTTSHTLTGLEVYTQYLISVRVTNPEGEGPDTIVVVMTDEGAPSSPRNVKLLSVQAHSLQLSWWEPARPNGLIQVQLSTSSHPLLKLLKFDNVMRMKCTIIKLSFAALYYTILMPLLKSFPTP